jgi:hypothetical protein
MGGGILEETSWRRHHGGGILEEGGICLRSTLDASGVHQGGISEASGKLLEGFGRDLVVSGVSRSIWGVLGVSAHKVCTILQPFAYFRTNLNFTMCFEGTIIFDFMFTGNSWRPVRPDVGGQHCTLAKPPEPIAFSEAVWGTMRF